MSDMTRDIDARLKERKLALPAAAPAAANYVPFVVSGNMLYIAGQIPFMNGEKNGVGRLGDGMSIEEGKTVAQACALNILAQTLAAVGGDETRIVRCVRLGGFVNCTPDFTDMPAVVNGASDVMVQALGERGRHARAAVGVSSLPFGVAVEVEAVFEIKA